MMQRRKILASVAVLSCMVCVEGFISQFAQLSSGHPALQEFTQNKIDEGTLLNIKLNIEGPAESKSGLPIRGLELELLGSPTKENGKHPNLPGINGPHSKFSTGRRSLIVRQSGQVIDLSGTRMVPLEDGCWEMVWKEGNPAGCIVIGFNLPSDVKRNEATLKAGRVYLSFPVWTGESLVEQRTFKKSFIERAKKYTDEKEHAYQMMKETNNILTKALQFRKAALAVEKLQVMDFEWAEMIPNEGEVTPIERGLLLATKGTVWTKKDSFFGAKHYLLGSAVVVPDIARASP